MSKPRVLVSWSSGKDAAWTLHRLRQERQVEVVGLLTTVHREEGYVPVHATPLPLLLAQAQSTALPLLRVPLPWPCPNVAYEAALQASLEEARRTWGVTHLAFGDLFLADIRAYRETLLQGTGVAPLFPLWGLPTATLAGDMIRGGLRAVLTCVNSARLSGAFVGRLFDRTLLEDLPDGVDACGEAGEFHTFAWDGPMFAQPVRYRLRGKEEHQGFVQADLGWDEPEPPTDKQGRL